MMPEVSDAPARPSTAAPVRYREHTLEERVEAMEEALDLAEDVLDLAWAIRPRLGRRGARYVETVLGLWRRGSGG